MGACLSSQHQEDGRKRSRAEQYESDSKEVNSTPKPLDLSQFELRRVVGKGAFGKVKVVVHKATDSTYALKYISKAACIARQAAPNVIRERKILEALCHPLVCNLRFAFQDADYLYLVSDLMLGGDLRFHLLRKTFTEETVRHWIAETVAALGYCHSRGILHRDVKPDNILLTAEGHTKLADFNISTQIRNNILPHSRSGSLFYMAPEVHEGLVYDFAVDYWSLGVVMFEAIYGHRPFGGKNNVEVSEYVCHRALHQHPVIPAVSVECQQAISALLERDTTKRVQSISSVAVLPFFSSLDWHLLPQGKSMPVYVPGSGKNFDAAWELEEILLHDSPLESHRPTNRKRPTTESVSENEMYDLMEKHFTEFDFTTLSPEEGNEKYGSLHLPARLTSDVGIPATIAVVAETDYVNSEGIGSAPDVGRTTTDDAEVVDVQLVKGRHNLFKSKPKKPVIIPRGVLAMKSGARVRA
ncbi:putative Protein kinase [Taphrina deformans PYCC 5710]|uniref:non-specific serine/threonine protein kinase n=1 Tax=Taphrina deformans (strain PYCC 5710 / ATCC 11124 / CBS 356.35 / IMI 108563 / JCM 9778 / NBRC 8474) TaxID=1097556 RepID=R4XIE0_TAPDE|nr:putative Protein kinase [Taphrina deformans PYCC 5710]|eukprot:CCG83122.1 putative Protein kinase [Taphrina deformans PYCC 5710]